MAEVRITRQGKFSVKEMQAFLRTTMLDRMEADGTIDANARAALENVPVIYRQAVTGGVIATFDPAWSDI